jgi:bifunctional pyridoxal-dependent enzyme with beta-cystathionase and maltose regulon repressor activities
VSKYEEAILKAADDGVKIRAMLLCNPHNPVGRCYTIDALKALFALCHKHRIHLISDEIYGLSVFDVRGSKRTPFTCVLSIDPTGLLGRIKFMFSMACQRYFLTILKHSRFREDLVDMIGFRSRWFATRMFGVAE